METVRCAIFRSYKEHKQVLMLQKDKVSKNPYALEFPGGKMFDSPWQKRFYEYLCPSKRWCQKKQIQREIKEEAGLLIKLSNIKYLGERTYKNSATKVQTKIYNFFTELKEDQSISINNLGWQEDKHIKFVWLGFHKFRHYCRQKKGSIGGFVCKNSRFPMLWRNAFV